MAQPQERSGTRDPRRRERYREWFRKHLWLSSAICAAVASLVLTIQARGLSLGDHAGQLAATFAIFFVIPGFIRWTIRNQRL